MPIVAAMYPERGRAESPIVLEIVLPMVAVSSLSWGCMEG